ncbi:MAG: ABC transporter permease [Bacteroidota bacterium]|nr:ABC transporter permease [Bacteroidota bacterium]
MTFLLKRLWQGLGVLIGTLTLVFAVFAWVPDPARELAGQNEREEVVEALRIKYGLNKPVVTRYFNYMSALLPFGTKDDGEFGFRAPSLGNSFITERPVTGAIGDALPPTLLLACVAMLFASIFGITIGITIAVNGPSKFGNFIISICALGMSAPSFVVAIIVAWLFGYVLHSYTGLPMTGGLVVVHPFEGPKFACSHIILPALTLGIRPLAVIVQLSRNSALEVLDQPFIRTAKAKGLSKSRIVFKHVLRNSLNPVITATSGWFASMLAGAIFVEFVFGWKGMGLLMFSSLEKGDLPVVMGCTIVIATVFVIVNILVDLFYGVLDPRVRQL